MTRHAALLLALLALAGCGFSPLYAPAASGAPGPAQAGLAAIQIALIPDRPGQELREALQERFERGGVATSARYDLFVSLSIGAEGIAIDPSSASTRTRLIGSASWTLKDQGAGHATLASGAAHALDGFNIINQQFFAADMAREAGERRVTNALADQIAQQLAVHFRQHEG